MSTLGAASHILISDAVHTERTIISVPLAGRDETVVL